MEMARQIEPPEEGREERAETARRGTLRSTALAAKDLVAGVADFLDGLGIHKTGLGGSAGGMARMAANTGPGIGVGGLPTRQERMPVVSPALALAPTAPAANTSYRNLFLGAKVLLGDILVTFEAVRVADWEG